MNTDTLFMTMKTLEAQKEEIKKISISKINEK